MVSGWCCFQKWNVTLQCKIPLIIYSDLLSFGKFPLWHHMSKRNQSEMDVDVIHARNAWHTKNRTRIFHKGNSRHWKIKPKIEFLLWQTLGKLLFENQNWRNFWTKDETQRSTGEFLKNPQLVPPRPCTYISSLLIHFFFFNSCGLRSCATVSIVGGNRDVFLQYGIEKDFYAVWIEQVAI